jgi:hypothetical protein
MPNGHFLESTGRTYGRKHSETLSNELAIHATITIVLPFHRTYTSTELIRCTIVPTRSDFEIGRGFFEEVCTPSNATANFRDPPLLRSTKTGALARELWPMSITRRATVAGALA